MAAVSLQVCQRQGMIRAAIDCKAHREEHAAARSYVLRNRWMETFFRGSKHGWNEAYLRRMRPVALALWGTEPRARFSAIVAVIYLTVKNTQKHPFF